MYPCQKKGAVTWMTQIFLGLAVLILIGSVAFGIMVTRDGGTGFQGLSSGDDGNPLSFS